MTAYAGIQNTITRFDEFVHKYNVDASELLTGIQNCDDTTVDKIKNRVRENGENIDSIETVEYRRLQNVITEHTSKEVTNNIIYNILDGRNGLYKVNKIKTGWEIERLSKELLENKIRK